ncbi:unnamed protein product [Strongylus vulgaris]|uniref:STT3/PglB/AglB core domain-containing protein n=1 Tax=Strongylus vulgaris TaxID=40348 RepID=A0A3P7IUW1_STRVU|nr:unnamed protein product [Strongylus vulgaris]
MYDKVPKKGKVELGVSVVGVSVCVVFVLSNLSLCVLLFVLETSAASEAAEDGVGVNSRSLVSVVLVLFLLMFVVHATYVTSNAYSHPSVVLQSSNSHGDRIIMDDFREAYHWLRENTADDARIMSWWDYGYQIAGMANRTTLVDNNTWNNSHIALVGKAMSSNESAAYEIMHALDVDYVLVIFGGVIGYSGDDINKFLWMVRIAEGEHPKEIKVCFMLLVSFMFKDLK